MDDSSSYDRSVLAHVLVNVSAAYDTDTCMFAADTIVGYYDVAVAAATYSYC